MYKPTEQLIRKLLDKEVNGMGEKEKLPDEVVDVFERIERILSNNSSRNGISRETIAVVLALLEAKRDKDAKPEAPVAVQQEKRGPGRPKKG